MVLEVRKFVLPEGEIRFGIQTNVPIKLGENIDVFFFEAKSPIIGLIKEALPKEMVLLFSLMQKEIQIAKLEQQLAAATESRDSYCDEITKKGSPFKQKPEFVYILKADNGAYKIGQTKNLNSRIATINGTLPYDTELIHTIKTEDSKEAERFFHKKFGHRCIRGEWFELTEEDIEQLKQTSEYPIREEDI